MKLFSPLIPALTGGAALYGALSLAGTPALPYAILTALLILAGGFGLKQFAAGKQRLCLLVLLIGLAAIIFAGHEPITKSFPSLASLLAKPLETPYGLSFSLPQGKGDPMAAILCLSFLTAWLFAGGAIAPILRGLAGLFALFMTLFPLYFGAEPSIPPLLIICGYWLSLLAAGHRKILPAIPFLAAPVLGSLLFFIYPPSSYQQPAFLSRLEESILSFTDPYGSLFHAGSGYAGIMQGSGRAGTLGESEGIHFTGRVVASVDSAETDQPLYIRSISSGRWKDNRWTDPEDDAYTSVERIFKNNQGEWYDQGAWLMEVIAGNPSLYEALSSYTDETIPLEERKRDFSVTAVYDSTNLFLLPYDTSFGAPLFRYDQSPRSSEGKAYTTYRWALPTGAALSFLQDMPAGEPYLDTYRTGESMYRRFAYGEYTAVPDDVAAAIRSLLPVKKAETLSEKREWLNTVRAFLAENYKYTTHPGRTPAKENFITYFLTKQKQGYCNHFASAAVMMIRMAGIPARYAAGLYVPASDVNDAPRLKSGDHRLEITDRHAHAWAEVYVDGLGWRPFDVTPGDGMSENPIPKPAERKDQNNPAPPQKNPANSPQPDPQKEQNNTPSDNQPKAPQKQNPVSPSVMGVERNGTLLPFVLLLLLSILAVWSTLRMTSASRLLKKAAADPKAFERLPAYTEKLAAFFGHPRKESDRLWVKQITKDVRFTRFDQLISLLTADRFSGRPLAPEERQECATIAMQIRQALLASMTLPQKIKFTLIHKL